jgi:hypothetical protein
MEIEKTSILLTTPGTTTPGLTAPGSSPHPASLQTPDKTLQGSVLVLIQFDVSEEIRLDDLRDIFGARRQEASFKHPSPGYVRYQRPPVLEPVEPLVLESGERLDAQIKYYDYGVLSVVLNFPSRETGTNWFVWPPLGLGYRLHQLRPEDRQAKARTRSPRARQAL